MSSTLSAQNLGLFNLSNLTAPASGITHAIKLTAILSGSGTISFPWSQVAQQAGFTFVPQAMTVDNSGNTVAVTIAETAYGWKRVVPAGYVQTFQFPAIISQPQVFTVAASAAVSVPISFLDWPAFPDGWGANLANASGQPVTGTLTVNQGNSLFGNATPWVTEPETYSSMNHGNGGASFFVGGSIILPANPTDSIVWSGTTPSAYLKNISLQGVSSSAGSMAVQIIQRQAANTGGTFTTPPSVASEGIAAGSTVSAYTVNPTSLGTAFAIARSVVIPFEVASSLTSKPTVLSFGNNISRGLGVDQYSFFSINFGGAAAPAGAVLYWGLDWTE